MWQKLFSLAGSWKTSLLGALGWTVRRGAC